MKREFVLPPAVSGDHAPADALIRALYTEQISWASRQRVHDAKQAAVFACLRGDEAALAALYRLVYGVPGGAGLASIDLVSPALGPQAGNTGWDALLHLARFHVAWVRNPEEWQPETGASRAAHLASLARHLLALYPLPAFLDAGWLSGTDEQADQFRGWFAHLGGGGRLEDARFPIPMTHRAAHHFLLAPPDFSLPAALRFGQLRALGGSEAMARALSETFLRDLQTDEAFWWTFVQFLVNHPDLPTWQIGPVADFVRFRRFGTTGDDGPEPRFLFKGRTTDALLARMNEWHETLNRLGKKARSSWAPSGIPPLSRVEPDSLSPATCHWRIVEITDSLGLLEEGREMRHCVRTYQDRCVQGTTAVWSVRLALSDNPAPRRLLTVEVNLHRRALVQVRGKCNQTMSAMRGNRRMDLAHNLLKEWARERHLGIACPL